MPDSKSTTNLEGLAQRLLDSPELREKVLNNWWQGKPAELTDEEHELLSKGHWGLLAERSGQDAARLALRVAGVAGRERPTTPGPPVTVLVPWGGSVGPDVTWVDPRDVRAGQQTTITIEATGFEESDNLALVFRNLKYNENVKATAHPTSPGSWQTEASLPDGVWELQASQGGSSVPYAYNIVSR